MSYRLFYPLATIMILGNLVIWSWTFGYSWP